MRLAMAGGSNGGGGLTADRVTDFLKNNRNFLEDHVLEHIERETLERWLIRRTQREKKAKSGIHPLEEAGRKISLSRWKVQSYSFLSRQLFLLKTGISVTYFDVLASPS